MDAKEQYKIMCQTANKLLEGFEENYSSTLSDSERKILTDYTMFIYSIQTNKDLADKLIKQHMEANNGK